MGCPSITLLNLLSRRANSTCKTKPWKKKTKLKQLKASLPPHLKKCLPRHLVKNKLISNELRRKNSAQNTQKPMPPTGPVGGGPGGAAAAGGGGHSAFLQKRLAKGQKYFDSGDYQMGLQNKQKGPRGMGGRLTIPVQGGLSQPSTGDTIPTPDTVPARKLSIIQPQHDHTRSVHVPSDPAHIGLGHHGVSSPPGVPGQPMANPAITKLAL